MRINTKPFQENIFILVDEIHLARNWGRASILLTIHKSIHSQWKTKNALRKKLENSSFLVVDIDINKFGDDFIEYMLKYESLDNTVFQISNIGWGGGEDEKNGYRLLNLYRETFIDHNIKAVFFLTLKEASNMPNYAPDFWAFRHHTLGFGSPRAYNQERPPVGIMFWQIENSFTRKTGIKEKISSRTKLLKDISDKVEAVSMRIDLLYELGFLHWQLGDVLNAEKSLLDGIELAKAFELIELLSKLKNGLAIIRYEQGKFRDAMKLLGQTTGRNLEDCLLLLNQAVVLFAIKKRYRAITTAKKATTLCAQNAWVWNSLGYLYYFAGKLDEAASCFQCAIDISPTISCFYESLAIFYLTLGLKEKASAQLRQAQSISDNRKSIREVLRECIEEDMEKAIHFVEEAIETGNLSELDIGRDPTLSILFKSQFAKFHEVAQIQYN